jgi:hypothetical protein
MSELEPEADPSERLWFGAALVAMTVIAWMVGLPR